MTAPTDPIIPEPILDRTKIHLPDNYDPVQAFIDGYTNGWHASKLAHTTIPVHEHTWRASHILPEEYQPNGRTIPRTILLNCPCGNLRRETLPIWPMPRGVL